MKNHTAFVLGLFTLPVLVLLAMVVHASSVTTPTTFVSGTTILASEVNDNFAAHEAAINDNDSRIDALEAGLPIVTYATGVGQDSTDDGAITSRTLTFTKVSSSTRLRITWSDTIRIKGDTASAGAASWEILIDGSSIATPGPLQADLYESVLQGNDHHRPVTVVGYAEGVAAGTHTVSISVGPVPGQTLADALTGWNTRRFLLQVEELP